MPYSNTANDVADICIYSGAAKNTKIRSHYLSFAFLKKIALFALVCLVVFFAAQQLMKSYLTQIDEKLTTSLHSRTSQFVNTTENTATVDEEQATPSNQLESLFLPIQSEYDISF